MSRWRMVVSPVVLLIVGSGCASETDGLTTDTPPAAGPSPTATVVTAPTIETTRSDEELVTFDFALSSDVITLDPQIAGDVYSIMYVENLFVQLTNIVPETGEIVPEAAKNWQISEDGRVHTFHLRNDIPWVHHDPATGETAQVTNENGQLRFVTAGDFADGMRRACDKQLGSYYSGIIGRVIAGCEERLPNEDPGREPALVEAVGVSAPDDETLVITLKHPAGYFQNMTALWTLSAIPSWTIKEHGAENWLEPGRIVTSGRYVLTEQLQGQRLVVERNPLMPEDLRGQGNIDRVVGRVIPDLGTAYLLWANNEIDVSSLPDAEVDAHLAQYADQTIQFPEKATVYLGFVNSKAPFDDARVRRAFSAAIDRDTLAGDVLQGQGVPMIHFAPPGIFGAPPIDEVGLGFNPEFAREQLADAGYPNCEGLAPVSLLRFDDPNVLSIVEYIQAQWEEHLGCSAQAIQVEQSGFGEFFAAIDANAAVEIVPHIFTLGWAADYADENNWVGDVLWCGNEGSPLRRPCSAVDELILEAAAESDSARRIELYRQIEEAFFGPEGEMPLAPLYQSNSYLAAHDWLDSSQVASTNQWYMLALDWEAKREAQE